MKKSILLLFVILGVSIEGFSQDFIVENQTVYPVKESKSKIAIQWAHSAREVNLENNALMCGEKLNLDQLQLITQKGKIKVSIPEQVEYFRVLVWSKEEDIPDFSTNWIDVVPNKTYILKTDHLVPVVLMSGMGC